jgi:hypothetical protein
MDRVKGFPLPFIFGPCPSCKSENEKLLRLENALKVKYYNCDDTVYVLFFYLFSSKNIAYYDRLTV